MKRVCLLTGASGRFGRAFCETYSGEYDIVAVYRERLPSVASQLASIVDPLRLDAPSHGNKHPVFAVRCDLFLENACDRLVDLALARFGRVDVLINAAALSTCAPIITSARLLDNAAKQFELNTITPLRLATVLARRCWRDDLELNLAARRNIIHLSSLAGSQLFRGRGQSIYAASKAALDMLTIHMAHEFASIGIRVNAIAPDSFPSIVSTKSVVEAARTLDQGQDTGSVIKLTA